MLFYYFCCLNIFWNLLFSFTVGIYYIFIIILNYFILKISVLFVFLVKYANQLITMDTNCINEINHNFLMGTCTLIYYLSANLLWDI